MKTFSVQVPIAGYMYITVEAENAQEAMEFATGPISFEIEGYYDKDLVNLRDDIDIDEIYLDALTHLVQGNFLNVETNEISMQDEDGNEYYFSHRSWQDEPEMILDD